MGDPYVREIGRVVDLDGRQVPVGVDYDSVVILGYRIGRDQIDDLGRIFITAAWEAGENKRCMAEEVHEADGGDSMEACGTVKGLYECTETGPHKVHLARDIYGQIKQAWDAVPDG